MAPCAGLLQKLHREPCLSELAEEAGLDGGSPELKAVLHGSLARIDMRIRTVAMRTRSTLSNSPWVCPASAADRSGKQQLPSSR
jgi:hypothetical protein